MTPNLILSASLPTKSVKAWGLKSNECPEHPGHLKKNNCEMYMYAAWLIKTPLIKFTKNIIITTVRSYIPVNNRNNDGTTPISDPHTLPTDIRRVTTVKRVVNTRSHSSKVASVSGDKVSTARTAGWIAKWRFNGGFTCFSSCCWVSDDRIGRVKKPFISTPLFAQPSHLL
jgi:hypothetical protein